MTLRVATNNHERPVLHWLDLTAAEQRQFAYIRDAGPAARHEFQGFRFRGELYDLGEFEPVHEAFSPAIQDVDDTGALTEWSAALCQSATTAILVRFKTDFGTVIAGWAQW
jgi:hypothetical protein